LCADKRTAGGRDQFSGERRKISSRGRSVPSPMGESALDAKKESLKDKNEKKASSQEEKAEGAVLGLVSTHRRQLKAAKPGYL